MKLSSFLTLKAIVSLVFGIMALLAPAALMSLYGIIPDDGGMLMARFFGALLTGIGLICWLARSADREALRGITLALFIADTAGFTVALVGQLSGLVNVLGWINVIVWLFFALGLGYFRFFKLSNS
ncbi:MAG: hypothetical protein JW902_07485 [Syntrophaceae bacterium]|nr:hypothetical protein [Syntrophaceae bacterium]